MGLLANDDNVVFAGPGVELEEFLAGGKQSAFCVSTVTVISVRHYA